MAYNKVILNGETKIDLTQDTVTAEDVVAGKTFTLNNGEKAEGVLDMSGLQEQIDDLDDRVTTLESNQGGTGGGSTGGGLTKTTYTLNLQTRSSMACVHNSVGAGNGARNSNIFSHVSQQNKTHTHNVITEIVNKINNGAIVIFCFNDKTYYPTNVGSNDNGGYIEIDQPDWYFYINDNSVYDFYYSSFSENATEHYLNKIIVME